MEKARNRTLALCVIVISVSALTLGIALILRAALQPQVPGQVCGPLFLGSVAVCTWLGGSRVGLFATLLSIVSLEYFVMPPVHSLHFGWEDIPRVSIFLFVALLVGQLNSRRHRAEKTLQSTHEQLRIARTIQQRLFPEAELHLANFEVSGESQPADATGGDYFDYVPMRGGCLGVVVGDVSGHGFGPSLLMAETRAYVRALARFHDDPGALLTELNCLLAHDTDDERFLTVFFARIDPAARSFIYAGAGHEGYFFDSAGVITRLESTGLALAIDIDAVIPCSAPISFEPGDLLISLTDGFSEAQTRDFGQFGTERILDVICKHRHQNANAILRSLFEAVHDASRGISLQDDLTAVVVKVEDDSISPIRQRV